MYGTTNLLNTSKWRWQQQKQQQQRFKTRHVEPLVYLEWRGREPGPGVKLGARDASRLSGIFFWLPVIARLTTVVIFVCFFSRSFFLFLICFFLLLYAFFVSYTFFCFCTLDLLILVIFAFEHFLRSYL